MPINRRLFLSSVASAAAGSAATAAFGKHTDTRENVVAGSDLNVLDKFYIYTGCNYGNYRGENPYHFRRGHESMLTKVSLKNDAVTQSTVAAGSSHYPFVSPKHDRIVMLDQYGPKCVVLDMDHKEVTAFPAPEGYIFSGHGLLLEGTDNLVIGLYRIGPKTLEDEGMLMVMNLANSTPTIDNKLPSHGLQPHDMSFMPGKKLMAVAHAGSTLHHEGKKEFRYTREIVNPGIALLNTSDLSLNKFLRTPENAEVTHLAVRDDGKIVCCLNQKLNTGGLKHREADLLLADEFKTTDFLLDESEMRDRGGGVSLSLPALMVDPETGQSTPFMESIRYQRQGQSVAFNQVTGTTVVSFLVSSGLLFIGRDGKAEAIPSGSFGIYNVSGLADIPGTPYMAMCGHKYDMVIVDMRTRSVVHTIRMPMLRATHLVAQTV
ncbi:MAG: DUF1513 domain-containing protein [Proteobacteria bacterium]|nr:DUF1513 domain-containing protein [Pseudomonadota bacterium]